MDHFIEQYQGGPKSYKITMGITRVDVIIKRGGLLDKHLDNFRRFGLSYGKQLTFRIFPQLEAKCYELLKSEPEKTRADAEMDVKVAFEKAYHQLNEMRRAALYRYLDLNISYLLDVLDKLVRFETVAPPGSNYNEIVDYLVPIFSSLGFDVEKVKIPPEVFHEKCSFKDLAGDRANLRAHLDTGAKETLVIYTHLDVVPPGSGWSTDPFRLEVDDEKVYGRGVSDSKGAVAALIAALRAIKKYRKFDYNLDVVLTTDEEVGGYSGLCYFADSGFLNGNCMLCMDGYSDDLVIGSNGIITWEVTVHGKSAHSGTSFLGVNAIEKALTVIGAIFAHKRVVEARRSALPASSALEKIGVTHLMPVLNINIIEGGIKENIVPNRCVLRGDRRVIPEEEMEKAAIELENVISNLDIDLDWRWWYGYPPMAVDPNHPWVGEVRRAVEMVRGNRPKLSGAQGSLDQAYAVKVTGIPTCVYGVGRQVESNAHGADENIRIDDLLSYAKFLATLVSS